MNIENKISVNNVIECLLQAGDLIQKLYLSSHYEISYKKDNSPVTTADKKSEEIILHALTKITPNIPIISEESFSARSIKNLNDYEYCWLVDPLDGTKGYIQKTGEFTINIALLKYRVPVLGFIHIPLTKETFWGISSPEHRLAQKIDTHGQTLNLEMHHPSIDNLILLESRSFPTPNNQYLLPQGAHIKKRIHMGSALKFCCLADNMGDIHIRIGPTMEWDTAAGHALLSAAGGKITTLDNKKLSYFKKNLCNPSFIACHRSFNPSKSCL